MNEDTWNWLSAGAASGGTVVGVAVGGGLGILGARAVGFSESVADYDAAFLVTVGTACVLGLVGCYLALRVVGDERALSTVLILALLMPGSALSLEPIGQALARAFDWGFGLLIPLGVILYVSCVVVSPVVARIIAGFLPAPHHRPSTRLPS